MDANRFDQITKRLSASDTRRGVVGLLTALPIAGALAVLLEEETEAAGRRKRRKKRHKHQAGDGKENRKGKRKGKDKGKKKCKPESVAQTCAGKCAIVSNRCGAQVDCGPCTCASGCPACQPCNTATGLCVPVANDTPCDDGDACTQTDTCQGGVCVGSDPVVCTALDQCHVAGTCNPATGDCSNPNAANGTECGTQSETGGGTIHCCNGDCPDPECLPAGQPCLDLNDCGQRCCTHGPTFSGGNWTCSVSGLTTGASCGSDVDCDFGICQCEICCDPPGATPTLSCASCCTGACAGSVCD